MAADGTPGWTARLFGVPVTIKPSFFVVGIVLGSPQLPDVLDMAIWLAVVTFSILWHEFGHVIGFRIFGRASRVELWSFGGLTYSESQGGPLMPSADVAVSLAGPAAGLLLGGALYLASRSWLETPSSELQLAIDDLLRINIGWSLVNLLPVLPLDGGRALSSLVRIAFRGGHEQLPHIVSIITAGIGLIFGIVQGEYWISFSPYGWAATTHRDLPVPGGYGGGATRSQSHSNPVDGDGLEALASNDLRAAERIARAKLESPRTGETIRAPPGSWCGRCWYRIGRRRQRRCLSITRRAIS